MLDLVSLEYGMQQLHRAAFETAPEQGRIGVGDLLERYRAIRALSVGLCAGLSAEDCQAQSMADASPLKWHLAHTTWFFETFLLAARDGYQPYNAAYAHLFNSYYNSVGTMHPRPQRGLLTRPGLPEVLRYRHAVDDQLLHLLATAGALNGRELALVELGLQHEQQHQELMLTDLKHLFACNPHMPAYRSGLPVSEGAATPLQWIRFPEGLTRIGHDGNGFGYDNEQPAHRVYLSGFSLASRLVSNAEYLDFIRDDGYRNPAWWLADGWALVKAEDWSRPLYWAADASQVFTLGGLRTWQPHDPVSHLSYYEADAFARWAGARLPTEAEWEHAAAQSPIEGNFLEAGFLEPRAATRPEWFGNVWQWTSSAYAAYPGFKPSADALGEYNGKFMCNQMVLRGGSCLSSASHLRATYRNFFYPQARWQCSGLRLARDLP